MPPGYRITVSWTLWSCTGGAHLDSGDSVAKRHRDIGLNEHCGGCSEDQSPVATAQSVIKNLLSRIGEIVALD